MEVHDELSAAVIGAAIEVHREIGPGLLESVYQECMEEELQIRDIKFNPQVRLPLRYKSKPLKSEFVLDIYFPDRLVVELKAIDKLMPIHEAQLLTYLRLTRVKVGLLLNFNVPVLKDGIRRMVL